MRVNQKETTTLLSLSPKLILLKFQKFHPTDFCTVEMPDLEMGKATQEREIPKDPDIEIDLIEITEITEIIETVGIVGTIEQRKPK